MSMFSGNVEKKIPKSLKECYEAGDMVKNLWNWCDKVEKFGIILFIGLVIFGIILSIDANIITEEVVTGYYYKTTEEETIVNYTGMAISLITWAVYAFIEYCAYHVIALLIGSLASIVQSTKITANVNLYRASLDENVIGNESIIEKTKCPPPKSVPEGPKPSLSELAKETKTEKGKTIKCKNCGSTNDAHALSCVDCGTYF